MSELPGSTRLSSLFCTHNIYIHQYFLGLLVFSLAFVSLFIIHARVSVELIYLEHLLALLD